MANFRIDLENLVPLILLIPTYSVVSGAEKKTFPAPEDIAKRHQFLKFKVKAVRSKA